jgi:hypothetical protein
MVQVLQILENLSLVLNPTKMNLEHENKGYLTLGQNGVPWNASGHTSGLEAVCSPIKFQVEPHLFQQPPIFQTSFLRLPKGS